MGTPQKDVIIKSDVPVTLLLEKHADYIASYGSKKDNYEYCMSEYLRMSGISWVLTVMDLMGQLDQMNREEILTFIKSCQYEYGGISASIGHDPHLLYTLSAVQILTLYDSINVVDANDADADHRIKRSWSQPPLQKDGSSITTFSVQFCNLSQRPPDSSGAISEPSETKNWFNKSSKE
ncbi:Hypothetical predicted protein [Marmota monax]|uniref:Geranylgeranyl transferase type II subunit beta n=1 Tax=Marmota monax TaxID=9995 RepID=A0A5E4B494_MARMO|nr:hypothetical protein GHT09_011153 [Marmota monax]VTJ63569.1 Hypothetical predicted protein [Marmota monax]